MDAKELFELKGEVGLWLVGQGISPDMLDEPELIENLERREGLGAWDVVRRLQYKYRLKPGVTPDLQPKFQLEFMMVVQGNTMGFLMAAALGGEKFK